PAGAFRRGIEGLLQRGRDAAERGVQLGADALHNGDDRNRDAGGDEAVFDGGRTRLVLRKALHKIRHSELHRVHTWLSERGPGSRYCSADPEPYVHGSERPLAARLIFVTECTVLDRKCNVVNKLLLPYFCG